MKLVEMERLTYQERVGASMGTLEGVQGGPLFCAQNDHTRNHVDVRNWTVNYQGVVNMSNTADEADVPTRKVRTDTWPFLVSLHVGFHTHGDTTVSGVCVCRVCQQTVGPELP